MARPYEDRPSGYFVAVSPNDSADLPGGETRAVYVGTAGALEVHDNRGQAVLFPNVQDGSVLPIKTKRVLAGNTTASNIVALY